MDPWSARPEVVLIAESTKTKPQPDPRTGDVRLAADVADTRRLLDPHSVPPNRSASRLT